ncbi:unnamed protein product [Protopolystoma xenopodis]|uniref:Uncharacterized protein n=1 Tax=Protopolystoma xenopodis TaxID=117903 RepID=A0A448XHB6_9PLAT|nr:unnamed protein product [Protopolystoma xenopodis]
MNVPVKPIDSWSRGIRRRLRMEPTVESLHPLLSLEMEHPLIVCLKCECPLVLDCGNRMRLFIDYFYHVIRSPDCLFRNLASCGCQGNLYLDSTIQLLVKETSEADPLTERVLNNCGISPSALGCPRFRKRGNVPRPRFNFGNDHADNGPRTGYFNVYRANSNSLTVLSGRESMSR